MSRGNLTEDVQEAARATLGRKISLRELRLIPYAIDCLLNDRNIYPGHINAEERDILREWREEGWISGGASDFQVTREFYLAACEILWNGYVKSCGREK